MHRSASAAILGLLVLALLVPGAAAHAVYLSSVPAKGARLDTPPAFVSVTISEPADPAGSDLQVVAANGTRVDLGDFTSSGGEHPTLRVSLPADLPDGAYRILWQAFSSADTHVTDGTVGFAVGDFEPPSSSGSGTRDIAWLGASGRFLAFLGLALGLGAALFLAWVPGAATVPRRPVLEALLLGAGLHLVGIVLLLKSTLDQVGIAEAAFIATPVGRVLAMRVGLGLGALAFAAIAMLPHLPARGPPYVAVVALAAAGLGSARYGHASLAGVPGIAVDAMHLLAAAAWAGGLVVFLWLLAEARRGQWAVDQVRLAGVRFGTAALVCVILLIAAGAGASLAILGPDAWRTPGATLATTWGRVLAAKVALTVAMLAIAAVNRYGVLEPARDAGFAGWVQRRVTPRWPSLRTLDGSAAPLRRLVRVEALLGVVTLALAGVLTSVSPPADLAVADAPFTATGFGVEFHGELAATPAPVVGGTSRLVVHIATHAGERVEGNTCGRQPPLSCVSVVVGGAGGERHALQPVGGGDWAVDGILWTQEGTVSVVVSVSTSEVQEPDELPFAVDVRPNA